MKIPAVHIPLGGILHVHHVVDGQLLPLLHLLHGDNAGDKSKARMVCIGPGAVRGEAVVQLVS